MDNKKSGKPITSLKKPHHYGKRDGIHLFHATQAEHADLVGKHIHNPSDRDLASAISSAKQSGLSVVVIHGNAPESLRSKIHPELGTMSPSQMAKSASVEKIRFDDLQKAFNQPDQSTFTDIKAHAGAIAATHPKLLEWGSKNLSPLPKDAIEHFELDGKAIKVRKHDSDLYSGWVEKNGNKLHAFEKITLPELLVQLQSKLELYGKEEEVTQDIPIKDLVSQLRDLVHPWFEEEGHEIPHHEFTTEPAETKEKLKNLKEKIDSKLSPDQEALAHAKAAQEQEPAAEIHAETVPNKDLVPGMLNPEKQCDDCGSTATFCDCYTGLPRPRLEFDGKKVTIFFKSENWDQESREAFVEDLKRRAGQILKSRHTKNL